MVLDEKGGPNHVANYCNAPIIANTIDDSVLYESSYYYIGHFSKFVQPDAQKIGFSRYTDQLQVAAFKNIDGKVAVIIMNATDKAIPYNLRWEYGNAKFESLSHSITTLIY